MMRNHMYRFSHVFIAVSLGIAMHDASAKVIRGDSTSTTETFTLPVREHVRDTQGGVFYVGAQSVGLGKYALSGLVRGTDEFTGLAQEFVILNRETGKSNPLYNAQIAFLRLLEVPAMQGGLEGHPVAVTQADLTSIHILDTFSNLASITMFSATEIKDAAAAVTGGIVGVGTTQREAGAHVIAAVKPNGGGAFGSAGSGMALTIFGTLADINDPKKVKRDFRQINAITGNLNQQLAYPFDTTSSFLKIGADLVSMTEVVDIWFDPVLMRFYVALQVTGGAGATDGGLAIAVGRVNANNQIRFSPIAPQATFSGTNKIVGAVGASSQISLQKVRTMWTTTRVNYLIVQGGVGAPGTTARSVFALPLINVGDKDVFINGTLAAKSAEPVNTFTSGQLKSLGRRGFEQPVSTTADLPLSTDAAALVGQGALAEGDITDLFVQGDVVYAIVGSADAGYNPGVFASQAIFDKTGKITQWTPWRRVAGTIASVFGATMDPRTAEFLTLTGATINTTSTVNRTVWGVGEQDGTGSMVKELGFAFNNNINGFFDFPTSVVSNNAAAGISLAVATGLKKVALVQTGLLNGTSLVPTLGDFTTDQKEFINGTITQTLPAGGSPKIVTISGGILDTLGALTSAEIGNDGTSGWLFVGGIGGVAVLSKDDNTGWTFATQLGDGFAGLTDGMSFKQIGNYSFVRKLIADGTNLYVLSDTKLDRIDVTVAGFGSITTLVTNDTFGADTLVDIVVSGKFALLATSKGIFRIANDSDVTAATPRWTSVSVPEGNPPTLQLYAISSTGLVTDVAKNGGGMIYALVAYDGSNRGQLNRYAVADVSATAITDTTLQPFNDFFIKNDTFTGGVPSYFVSFGQYRTLFATDGTSYFNARNASYPSDPFLRVLPIAAITGFRFEGRRSLTIPVDIAGATIINALVRNSATGSWITAGDFGLRVNE